MGKPNPRAKEENSFCRSTCSPGLKVLFPWHDVPLKPCQPSRVTGPAPGTISRWALPCRDRDALPCLMRALRGRKSGWDGFTADALALHLLATKSCRCHPAAEDRPCVCSALSSFSLTLLPNKMLKHFNPLEVLPSSVTGIIFVYI